MSAVAGEADSVKVTFCGFSQTAEYHKAGVVADALKSRIRIHPVEIWFPNFIGLAIDDEDSSKRNLLDGAAKGRTDCGNTWMPELV